MCQKHAGIHLSTSSQVGQRRIWSSRRYKKLSHFCRDAETVASAYQDWQASSFFMRPSRGRILVISSWSSGEIVDFLPLPRAVSRPEVLDACWRTPITSEASRNWHRRLLSCTLAAQDNPWYYRSWRAVTSAWPSQLPKTGLVSISLCCRLPLTWRQRQLPLPLGFTTFCFSGPRLLTVCPCEMVSHDLRSRSRSKRKSRGIPRNWCLVKTWATAILRCTRR